MDIPSLPSLFETAAKKTLKDGGISFDIDKKAYIFVKLPNVARIKFDYHANGYFYVYYATVKEKKYRLAHHLLMGRSLTKGSGSLDLNLRHTINWSPESYPMLIVQGTGQLLLKNIKATTVSDLSAYRAEKKRAFFWRPEVIRVTTINFLTPVFWDFENQLHWPVVLGLLFILAALASAGLAYFRGLGAGKYLRILSIIFIMVFSVHFIIRFIPAVNAAPFLSTSDKIKKYSLWPELGQLTAAVGEMIKPADKVVFMGEEGDWFSPETICFNIAPVKCIFPASGAVGYKGLYDPARFNVSSANVLVSYNSKQKLDAAFIKKYELNKNAYIAIRK